MRQYEKAPADKRQKRPRTRAGGANGVSWQRGEWQRRQQEGGGGNCTAKQRSICVLQCSGRGSKKTRSVQLWKKGPAKMSSVCFYSNSLKCVTPQLRSLSASLWTHIGPQPDKEIHTTLEILALSVVETILILGRYATTPRYLHRSYLGWTRVAS